jgi:hypothetical protein
MTLREGWQPTAADTRDPCAAAAGHRDIAPMGPGGRHTRPHHLVEPLAQAGRRPGVGSAGRAPSQRLVFAADVPKLDRPLPRHKPQTSTRQ